MPNEKQKEDFLKKLDENQAPKSVFLEESEQEKNSVKNDKIAEDKPKKKKGFSAIALFVSMFFLFLFTIVLFIFIMSKGGAGNPILKTFGIPEDGAKDFLLKLVNGSFATLGIILLLIFAMTLFIGLSMKKEKKVQKRGAFAFALVAGGMIFIVIVSWLFMYKYVDAIDVQKSASSGYINIIDLPQGELSAPIDIEFSAEKLRENIEDNNYNISGFRWDFGSGTFQAKTQKDRMVHHFDRSGRFEVRVEVSTEEGETETFGLEDRFFEIETASFVASPPSGNAPLRVEFDASSVSDGAGGSFSWDFDGDGIVDEETQSPTVKHTFEKIGRYSVKLSVRDNYNNINSFEKNILVKGEDSDRVRVIIKTTPEILKGEPPFNVDFYAGDTVSTDGKIVSYEWNFYDGSAKTRGEHVSHVFKKSGTFSIKLTVRDEMGTERSKTLDVVVNPVLTSPEIVLYTLPKMENNIIRGSTPLSIKLDASESKDADNNIVSYEWDFNSDREIDATGAIIEEKTFNQAGEYDAVLYIHDADDNVSEEHFKIIVEERKLEAVINTDPESGTGSVPLTVGFDGSSSWCNEADCHIVSYEWNFGDGSDTQSTGAQVNHYYPKIGIYDVKMTVYTNSDKKAEVSKKIYVRKIPLKSCFTPSKSKGIIPMTVSFDSTCSSGDIAKYEWNFGDGAKSTSRQTAHTFLEGGTYNVVLRVFDDENNVAEISIELVAGSTTKE